MNSVSSLDKFVKYLFPFLCFYDRRANEFVKQCKTREDFTSQVLRIMFHIRPL